MDEEKRKRLAAAGFVSVTVAEFLGLTPEQSELIEVKVALSRAVRQQRCTSSLSQSQLAERLGSSQSRIAKMERGDPHVSLDLMIRALLAAGMTRGELAEVISGRQVPMPDPEFTSPEPAAKRAGRRRTAGKEAASPQLINA